VDDEIGRDEVGCDDFDAVDSGDAAVGEDDVSVLVGIHGSIKRVLRFFENFHGNFARHQASAKDFGREKPVAASRQVGWDELVGDGEHGEFAVVEIRESGHANDLSEAGESETRELFRKFAGAPRTARNASVLGRKRTKRPFLEVRGH
jgi:hypothetical protein